MTPGPGIEPRTDWWEASALTTAPTLFQKFVLGKTVPSVLSTQDRGPYSRSRAQFFPIRTDLGRQITCLLFSFVAYFVSSICVEFSLQRFWNLGIIKLFFAMIAVVIWIHNCLSLRSFFTFYVLCNENKNCWKRRESWKISNGPCAGSGWENPDRRSARN